MELLGGKMTEPLTSENISTKLQRVAELAKEDPTRVFRSLAHHIDIEFLHEAHRRTRKNAAVGVDRQTASEYAQDLEGNLESLLERFKSGRYKAPPVRRVDIPKGDGTKTRPIGIPTFEDKVIQRAVAMVLESVYEQDFVDCSYGFRPGRSAHQALEYLRDGMMGTGGGWLLEVDIQGFFDSLEHNHLRAFLDRRVCDGVLRRMIDKWLRAGVMKSGKVEHSDLGTPQGGVISPLLANVYLHEVMDVWFRDVVQPRMRNQAFMVRYADDIVLVFEDENDARRVQEVLAKRFDKYGLTLHPEKTRLVRFESPSRWKKSSVEKPETFDFLGFTHYWARSRKGWWVIKRKTAATRFSRAIKKIRAWCKRNRHKPIEQQHKTLVRKLRGHCEYYGITGNSQALTRFRQVLVEEWRKWLNRRSQRARMTWNRFLKLLERYPFPEARATHSSLLRTARP